MVFSFNATSDAIHRLADELRANAFRFLCKTHGDVERILDFNKNKLTNCLIGGTPDAVGEDPEELEVEIAGYRFDPRKANYALPGVECGRLSEAAKDPNSKFLYLVQIAKSSLDPLRDLRKVIQGAGALSETLVQSVSANGFLVWLTAQQVRTVVSVATDPKSIVRAAIPFQPAWRLDPALWDSGDLPQVVEVATTQQTSRPELERAALRFYDRLDERTEPWSARWVEDYAPAPEKLSGASNEPRRDSTAGRQWTHYFRLSSKEELAAFLLVPDVYAISPLGHATLRNGTTSWVIQTNRPGKRKLFDYGLSGAGQVIGIIDDLIDVGHCFFKTRASSDPSATDKVKDLGVSPARAAGFHGTAVAGIAAGDNYSEPKAAHRGQAFGAQIKFAYVGDVSGWEGTPSNLYAHFVALYRGSPDGARIFTNSWGDDDRAIYGPWAQDVDRFTWDHEDALVVFAAANGQGMGLGNKSSRPVEGAELRDPARSPENAKNALSVGASRQAYYEDYKGAGVTSQTCDAVECRVEEGDDILHRCRPDHRICLSGVGEKSLARRKPELYAPGCWIHTALAGTPCGIGVLDAEHFTHHAGSNEVALNCATSWAAPAVAGAAALVREYFKKGYFPTGMQTWSSQSKRGDTCTPSGALLKAMLLNGTVDMTEVPAKDETTVPPKLRNTYPSSEEGWGRLVLDKSLYFSGDVRKTAVWDRRNAIGLHEEDLTATRTVKVASDTEELKVTLVWTEPPAWPFPVVDPVINDLDLEVKGPLAGGTSKYCAGDFDPEGTAWKPRGPDERCEKDERNNVEQVVIASPPPGDYEITVRAARINNGLSCRNGTRLCQGFALVVSGALDATIWSRPPADDCSFWPKPPGKPSAPKTARNRE